MSRNSPPSFHAVSCRRDECDWSKLGTSMVGLYADLEQHLKREHGYTDAEWYDALRRLEEERGR